MTRCVSAAKKRQSEIDHELLERRSRRSRLERMSKAVPLIHGRKRLHEQLGDVADAPVLPDDFSANRREAITKLAHSQQLEREALSEMAKLQTAIASVTIPTGLFEHRTAITQLQSGLGSYQKAAKDRPSLVAQQDQAERRARKSSRSWDVSPNWSRPTSCGSPAGSDNEFRN